MDSIRAAVKEMGALDVILLALSGFVIWKLVISKIFGKQKPIATKEPDLPPMHRRDMTVDELRVYDGVQRPDGRICMACNGKIFDVTKGKRLYGKDGPYGIFAGRDASRGLATFNASSEALRDTYDDLSDLNEAELEGMREWAAQFTEKYPIIGRLLKPGDVRETYSEDEGDDKAEDSETASLTPSTGGSSSFESDENKKQE